MTAFAAGPGPLPGPPAAERQPAIQIDREKVCPLLLRVFPKFGKHHGLEEYANRGQEPAEELSMYTWPDATLRELTELIQVAQPAAKRTNAQLEYALIYPDKRGRNVLRVIGNVWAQKPGPDDNKTLAACSFQTGDFLDVAIR